MTVDMPPIATPSVVPSGAARLRAWATPETGRVRIAFLHAAIGDSRMWHHEIATLGSTRRAVAYDRRGFGGTPAVHASHAPVDDAIAILDAFGIARAILVGCSNGGRVALDAAVAHPDRVAGLVLVCAAVGGAPEKPIWNDEPLKSIYAAWNAAEAAKDHAALTRIAAHVWLDGPLAADGRVGGPVRDLFTTMMAKTLDDPEDESLAAAPDGAYAALPDLRVPTLVYWGPLDVSTVTDTMRHVAATVPGATGVEIPWTGHLPNLERPDLFLPPLETFVSRLD